MNVLRTAADHNYPADYFFARMRAKRAVLPPQWRIHTGQAETAEAAAAEKDLDWRLLQEELLWSFRQMNADLRRIFEPFFVFMELRTIICCLRYQAAAMKDHIEDVLRDSLLAGKIQAILSESTDVASAIARVADCFGPELIIGGRQKEQTQIGLIKGFEVKLLAGFLQQTVKHRLHAELSHFFRMQIDLRNLMILAKHQRWSISEPPPLLLGGYISHVKLNAAAETGFFERAASSKDISGSWASGLQFSGYPQLEGALLKRISNSQTRRSRTGSGISLTLDYLWKRSLATRNASLSRQEGNLPSELLNEEFIQ
jgi:hypothetical protein